MTDKNTALMPHEGWHCLHLFYRIEYGQWQSLSREEQNAAKTNLASLVQEARVIVTFLPLTPAEPSREEARNRMLSRMRSGIPLGGPPYPRREEIYDRGRKE